MSSSTWVIHHRDGLGRTAIAGLCAAVVLTHAAIAVVVSHLSRQELHEPTISAMTVQWISPVQAPVPPPEPVKLRQMEPPKPRKETIVAAKPPVPVPQPVFQAPEPPKEEPKVVDNSPPPLAAAPATPVEPAAAPAPQPVSLSDLNCNMPEPDYPVASRRRKETGRTVVAWTVDTKGQLQDVRVMQPSGFPRLDEAAVAAVRRYSCKPRVTAGVAQASAVTKPFNWVLE